MRRSAIRTVLAVATLFVLATAVLPADSSAESLRDLLLFGRTHRVAKLLPTVVNISVHKLVKDDSDPSAKGTPRRTEAEGSGFVIDPSGLIVTNRHVIDDAIDITVTLSDGTALPAKLLGTAGTIDIALLQITPAKPLPKVTWGDSDNVRVGDQVLAIGNPLGLGESVSSGIVSAKNRDILGSPFDDYIQTDAAINHGNPGALDPAILTSNQISNQHASGRQKVGNPRSVGGAGCSPHRPKKYTVNVHDIEAGN